MISIALSAAGAKEAVARMREFLAADGINLKQTHAYEALARTLGYANWNTLQALLNAAPAAEKSASPAAAASADPPTAPTDDELKANVARALEAITRRSAEKRATADPPTSPRDDALKGDFGRALAALKQRGAEKQATILLSGDLVKRAIGLATGRHQEYATLEHLLLALIDDADSSQVMKACGVDVEALRKAVQKYVDGELSTLVITEQKDAEPTIAFQRVVQRTALQVENAGRDRATGANVLVALFTERESQAVHFLHAQNMNRLDAMRYISHGITKPPGDGQSG